MNRIDAKSTKNENSLKRSQYGNPVLSCLLQYYPKKNTIINIHNIIFKNLFE